MLRSNLEDLGEVHQCPVFDVRKVTQHKTKSPVNIQYKETSSPKDVHNRRFSCTIHSHCSQYQAGSKYKVTPIIINPFNMVTG